MKNPWFFRPRPSDKARVRLLVFHHAGGSASAYHKWHREIPEWADLILVELPGRGRRFQDPPFTDFKDLIDELSAQVQLELRPPYALFGHSLGALVSFELARRIPEVSALGLSSFMAPVHANIVHRAELSKLPDDELVKRIAKFAPLPQELSREPQFLKIYLDVIRADLRLIESYRLTSSAKLEIPTLVFGGTKDLAVRPEHLEGWKELTQVRGPVRLIEGDHFYIAKDFSMVLSEFLALL